MRKNNKGTLLLVANYPSDVGYAWWLMESFWIALAEQYHSNNGILLAYPRINKLPITIAQAPLTPVVQNFSGTGFAAIFQQCQFIRHNRVRAIYLSDRSTWAWQYLLYRLSGVRLIITHDHTPGLRTVPKGVKALFKTVMRRMPWFTVDGAVGATEFVKKRLINVVRMPAQKCFSAPNGLPTLTTIPAATDLHQLFDIRENRRIMVMTGRAHRYKGVLFILDAIARLDSPTRDKLHFLFVGDGPDLELFKQQAFELGVLGHCSFPGRRNDVVSLLLGADFAIHASQGEVGYSLSILEYMRAGLPVIVPDNPSVCGSIKNNETGIVYREHNAEDAAFAIQKLVLSDELRQEFGEYAKGSAQYFTLERAHQDLINAFKSIDRSNLLQSP